MSHFKKWTSKPPPVEGMWTVVGGLPAGPEHISALPALTSLAQPHCPQFKLIFSCTHWYSHSSCYGWCTSGCSVSLLTGYRGHSAWSSCPFWLVMVSILIGHGIYSNWSQQYFSLVTMSILIGHSIHLDWSQCPFWFIRTSFYLVPMQWQLLNILPITPSVHRESFQLRPDLIRSSVFPQGTGPVWDLDRGHWVAQSCGEDRSQPSLTPPGASLRAVTPWSYNWTLFYFIFLPLLFITGL